MVSIPEGSFGDFESDRVDGFDDFLRDRDREDFFGLSSSSSAAAASAASSSISA